MSNRNKGSFDRKKLQGGCACPGNPGKNGNWDFASRNRVRAPGVETAPGNGMEQNILRELMLVAALRGGGDSQ
jgi:GTPase involved in cell partitioning and DNA repair